MTSYEKYVSVLKRKINNKNEKKNCVICVFKNK